jgi:hypothetical protein
MFTYAQKLEGIGKFKIGETTTDIIKDIEKETSTTCSITNAVELYNDLYDNNDKIEIFEVLLDTTCKETRIFYISKYKISNIELKNIFLVFNEDYLIEFRCDKNKDLDILFAKKYGRPYIYQKDFSNLESNTLKYDEHIKRFLWKNLNIIAISFEKKQTFGEVNRDVISIFIIYDKLYRKVINDCDVFIGNLEYIKIEDI